MPKTLYKKTSTIDESTYKEAYKKYFRLIQLVKPTIKQSDGSKLEKAFHLAIAANRGNQYWRENANVLQALDIAWIVAKDIGLGIVSIICALLYDSAEKVTTEEIKKIFGAQVAQTIYRLTKLASIPQLQEIRNTQSSEALIVALIQDPKVVLLKMAETLQKMRTLEHLSYAQQANIASHAKYIYVPIAHRLGLNAIKAELEDLHFKFTNPVEYEVLKRQLKSTKYVRERLIKRFVRPIRETLKRKKLPFIIKTRIKSLTSIRTKMQATGLPLEQIYDIFAIRVILDVPESQAKPSCWVAHEVITGLYRSHPSKFRNWLSYPRNNGYQALHITVMSSEGIWVEVQIRAKDMDEIAEKGRAAHWRYKEINNMGQISGLSTWLNQIRNALEQESKKATELTNVTDTNPQIDHIEVFTRNGKMVTLPTGATVLDFAFALNTTLGLRCTGAQINNKLVAHDHVLHHGDQVKVTTAKQPKIVASWLEGVVTHKAQRTIKRFLQREQQLKIARGKQLLQTQIHQRQIKLSYEEYTTQLMEHVDEETAEHLYYKLGEGSITLRHLQRFPVMAYNGERRGTARKTLRPFVQDYSR
ncbi:MAG: HD domain-containing protein [Bacteroidota bacterium]